ncbi:MAG: hypothetical protein ACPGSM_16235 [Thiolinea sp.]
MGQLNRGYLLLILLVLCALLPIPAAASHAPYVWKFTCHPLTTATVTADIAFNARLKASYADPDFMARVERNMGEAGCAEGTSFADKTGRAIASQPGFPPKEAAPLYPQAMLNQLEKNYLIGHQAYEKLGFKNPVNYRGSGYLKVIGREVNLLFLGEKNKIMTTHGCNGDQSIASMATPISVSGNTYKIWKAGEDATLLMSAVHELGHLHQMDRWGFITNGHCDGAHKWIAEGIADHVAIKVTNDTLGTDFHGSYDNKYTKRFFLTRPYHVPLNLQPKGEKYADLSNKQLGYRTNGFWDFVTRRYLKDKPNAYDDLYEGMNRTSLKNQTAKIDTWLDNRDGKANGLEHVFPQFLAELSNWPDHRFQNQMETEKWHTVTFGGCQEVSLTPGKTGSLSLELDRYTGRCFKVKLSGFKTRSIPEASLHIEALGTAAEIDELYLGWAKASGTQNVDGDCYGLLDAEGAAHAPCLITPTQGKSPILPSGKAGRYWSTDKLVFSGNTELRFILSRVPVKHKDIGSQEDKKKITLNLGTSYASVTKKGQKKNAAAGVGRTSAGGGGMHAPVPVKGQGMAAMMSANPMMEAFKGRLGVEMPNALLTEQAYGLNRLEVAEVSVGYDDDDDAESEETLALMLQQQVGLGQTGTFPAIASLSFPRSDMLVIQDAKTPSQVMIRRYDRELLEFTGTAYLCKASLAKLQQAAMMKPPGQDIDVCEVGESVVTPFSGSMAFAALAIGNNAMDEIRTEAYEAYKELRIARIQSKFQQMGFPMPGGPDDRGSSSDDGDDAEGPESRGDDKSVAPVCDCSCEGLEKMEAMEEGDIDPSDMAAVMQIAQCAMTCMMQYAQCE